MKRSILTFAMAAVAGFAMSSCAESQEESVQSDLSLHARAIGNNETVGPGQMNMAGASLINFHVGFRDVGILREGEPVHAKTPVGNQEPFFFRLMHNQLPQVEHMGTSILRNDEFDRISFTLTNGSDLPPDNPLHDKSLLLEGTVNGSHLHIYTNVEKIITAHLFGGPYSINQDTDLFLNFDLNTLLQHVDLTTAQDGNGDGLIEIEPTNKDGNRELYNAIFNNLENAILINRE